MGTLRNNHLVSHIQVGGSFLPVKDQNFLFGNLYTGKKNYIQKGFGYQRHYSGIGRRPQRGAGLGNYFAKAYQWFRPLLKSGLSALADTGKKAGASALQQYLAGGELQDVLKNTAELAVNDMGTKAINKIRSAGTQKGGGKRRKKKNSSKPAINKINPRGIFISKHRKGKKLGSRTRKHKKKPKLIGAGRKRKNTRKGRNSKKQKLLDIF